MILLIDYNSWSNGIKLSSKNKGPVLLQIVLELIGNEINIFCTAEDKETTNPGI